MDDKDFEDLEFKLAVQKEEYELEKMASLRFDYKNAKNNIEINKEKLLKKQRELNQIRNRRAEKESYQKKQEINLIQRQLNIEKAILESSEAKFNELEKELKAQEQERRKNIAKKSYLVKKLSNKVAEYYNEQKEKITNDLAYESMRTEQEKKLFDDYIDQENFHEHQKKLVKSDYGKRSDADFLDHIRHRRKMHNHNHFLDPVKQNNDYENDEYEGDDYQSSEPHIHLREELEYRKKLLNKRKKIRAQRENLYKEEQELTSILKYTPKPKKLLSRRARRHLKKNKYY